MKSLFQFLSESQAVQQATRMGLKSDGHGGWYDNKGEFVAKTERGTLKFFNKRQRIGAQVQDNLRKKREYPQDQQENQHHNKHQNHKW